LPFFFRAVKRKNITPSDYAHLLTRNGWAVDSLKLPQKVENGDVQRFCNPTQKRCFPVVFPLLRPAASFKKL
jgi:hypothetical protein